MNQNKLGGACIIAGTAIGAGMLGLPMAIGGLGFSVGSLALFLVWIVAMYSGLLMLEVNLEVGRGAHLNVMSRTVLGKPGQIITSISVLFLLYCLLVAYITGMGGLIAGNTGLSQPVACTIFAVVSAVVLYAGTSAILPINSLLFMVMIGAMLLSFTSLGSQVDLKNLALGSPSQYGFLLAIPVLFTSFGFHTSIPSVVSIVGNDKKALVRIIVFGSTLPLFCYLVWFMVCVGGVAPDSLSGLKNVDDLIAILGHNVSWINTVLSLFALTALLTSFIGVSLSLFDFVAETFHRKNDGMGRAGTSAMIFGPTLAASLLAPDGFIRALSHAGAALSVIAILLPCVMAWKMRAKGRDRAFRAFGGRPALVLSFLCGLLIITANYL